MSGCHRYAIKTLGTRAPILLLFPISASAACLTARLRLDAPRTCYKASHPTTHRHAPKRHPTAPRPRPAPSPEAVRQTRAKQIDGPIVLGGTTFCPRPRPPRDTLRPELDLILCALPALPEPTPPADNPHNAQTRSLQSDFRNFNLFDLSALH